MTPQGKPPALPQGSRSLTVPAVAWLVGLEYELFPLTPTLSLGKDSPVWGDGPAGRGGLPHHA